MENNEIDDVKDIVKIVTMYRMVGVIPPNLTKLKHKIEYYLKIYDKNYDVYIVLYNILNYFNQSHKCSHIELRDKYKWYINELNNLKRIE